MIRLHKDGSKEASKLQEGKNGFAIAVFGDEIVATEIPNLLVTLAIRKKPAAAKKPATKKKKKPAAKKPAAASASCESLAGSNEASTEAEAENDVPIASAKSAEYLEAPKPKPFEFENGDVMYFTDAKEQCYICVSRQGCKKKSLVVALTRAQANKHKVDFRSATLLIWKKLVEQGKCCKDAALQCRQDLLNAAD